jgi:hypothetical protein
LMLKDDELTRVAGALRVAELQWQAIKPDGPPEPVLKALGLDDRWRFLALAVLAALEAHHASQRTG